MAYEDRPHYHKFILHQVRKEFLEDRDSDNRKDYVGLDMAILFCPGCGDVIKREVKDEDEI